MSLFVGNVSKHVTHRELETLFKKYGKSKIDLRDRFAFVQFDNDNHAEAAKKQLQHETFHGLQLNIQWSKNSGRFGENNKRKDGGGVQRKRSRSRQNRWRRDDRWGRRQPSNDRRSPSYSGNKEYENFVPVCPRDLIILKKITDKVKERQNRQRQRQNRKDVQSSKNNVSSAIINQKDQNKMRPQQVKQNSQIQLERPVQDIEIQQGAIHEDGQIPNHQ